MLIQNPTKITVHLKRMLILLALNQQNIISSHVVLESAYSYTLKRDYSLTILIANSYEKTIMDYHATLGYVGVLKFLGFYEALVIYHSQ